MLTRKFVHFTDTQRKKKALTLRNGNGYD